ncbi:MAG: 7-cyano-7-deazaguanine synthase [Candidatus Heimdallarchaeaceae archaeon]
MEKKKTVLLMSSGVDSFISNWLVSDLSDKLDIIRYYIDINGKYTSAEREFLEEHYEDSNIIFEDCLDLGELEQSDAYIPQRNVFFCALAQARFNPDLIFINGVKDDRVKDNDGEFYERISALLTYTSGKRVAVMSPLADKEKVEWVREWYQLNQKNYMDIFDETFSCFNPKNIGEEIIADVYSNENGQMVLKYKQSLGRSCANCNACFRRFCALTGANIFMHPFHNLEIVKKYTNEIDKMKDNLPNRAKSIKAYTQFLNWRSNG